MTDRDIQDLYNVSSEEYYEAMQGFEEWYNEVVEEKA